MAEVAALAGVTKMIVSRVLGEPHRVNEATRERVSAAAKALDYVPNRIAGALTGGSSGLVAAIVPTLRHSLFSDVLEGLADVLSETGSINVAHGIGRMKRSDLHLGRTAPELAVMASIKRALEPGGILSPGRVLP